MKVVLETTHRGNIGGGENYLMRLAMALDDISDLYVAENWRPEFEEYNGFYRKFKLYNWMFEPDLYIYSSHFSVAKPIGKKNWVATFFPKRELRPDGFDGSLSLCPFVERYVSEYWGLPSFILYPCIDKSLYLHTQKKNKIVSIGHFFEEPDGHSKNQHVLCSAFRGLDGYELVLIGNASQSDYRYLEKVRYHAQGKAVTILTNLTNREVKAQLAGARYLWHANGFDRKDPSQTEHFGIIVLEALASGAIPIVHNSGGARDIVGITWDRPEDLPEVTLRHTEVPLFPEQYTVESFGRSVEQWLSGV